MIFERKLQVSMFIANVHNMFKRNVLKTQEREQILFISIKQTFTD